MTDTAQDKEQHKRGDRWLLLTVLIVFLVGIGIRGYAYLSASPSTRSLQSQQSQNYTTKAFPESRETSTPPGGALTTSEGNGLLLSLAPYLTEGGLSFFLGFCLGYVLRLVAKVAIVAVGAIYFCLIVLSHYGIITVDWGIFQHMAQQLLLNTETQLQGLQGMISHSLPSLAMGGVGIWRGLKRS